MMQQRSRKGVHGLFTLADPERCPGECETMGEKLKPMLVKRQTVMEHELIQGQDKLQRLPAWDRDDFTRKACIVGLCTSYVLSLTSIGLAVILYARSDPLFQLNGRGSMQIVLTPAQRVAIDLALNILVTLCTETLGYIHTVSLRWALWRRDRLAWNSKLRLLNHAKGSITNSWCANAILGLALIISYAAASQIVVYMHLPHGGYDTVCNGFALLMLGVAILTQCIICSIAFRHPSGRFPTWSSDPLVITLACLHDGRSLYHRRGRCMLSAQCHRQSVPEGSILAASPARPSTKQPGMMSCDRPTRYIIRFVWTLPLLAVAPAIGLQVIVTRYWKSLPKQSFIPELFIQLTELTGEPTAGSMIGLLFLIPPQSLMTFGTHSIEVIVNRSRDERSWQSSGHRNKKGDTWKNSLMAALTAWQSIGLFVLKPITHWIFGNSIALSQSSKLYGTSPDAEDTSFNVPGGAGFQIFLDPRYIFGLSGIAIVLASFATCKAYSRPKGPMPAAWGCLQTLAGLVDDWGESDMNLHWGDKGQNTEDTRHAGTSHSAHPVHNIQMECGYA